MAYKVAGCVFDVKATYDMVPRLLESFKDDGDPEMTIEILQEEIDHERELSLQMDPDTDYSDRYLESLALLRKLSIRLLQEDVLLMHGSAVAVDGEVYIFTAKSGTGKSTHARLWRELLGERVIMVNDDKPFLKFGDKIMVCGTPWNGKHNLGTNTMLPLKAICLIEQAKENSIKEITFVDELPALIQQIYIPTKDANTAGKALELADKVFSGVKLYKLGANMEPDAAKLSYETMSGKVLEK